METLRRLPYVVRPLPDEPLESWLEVMAAAHLASLGEVGTAVGLIPSGSSWTHHSNLRAWSAQLTPTQVSAISTTTGLEREQVVAMTRINYAGSVARIARNGRISVGSAAGGNAGRYCPECLADSGGRWRLSWQFQFGFVCPRHRIILVDECPNCATPPRRYAAPGARVPSPGHCHNRLRLADGSRDRCGFDLRQPIAQLASIEVLRAQRSILRTLSSGTGSFGIYADNPQAAIRVLADIALLVRLIRAPRSAESGERQSAATATATAVDSAAAVIALGDRDRIGELLGRLRVAPQYAAHTAHMQHLISTSRGHHRNITTVIRTGTPRSAMDPAERARKIPAVLWEEWTDALVPRRIDREVAGGALAAAVVFAGTQLTHAAALKLLDPGQRNRRITHVMRDLDQTKPTVVHALGCLAAHLDAHPPLIDYARRRSDDYTGLLPWETWTEICRGLNVSPGSGLRWSTARASLYTRLSGNRTDRMPFETPTTVTFPAITRFRRMAPTDVLIALDEHAAQFLAGRNIQEPAVWCPPLSSAGLLEPTLTHGSTRNWPTVRPARARIADEIVTEYRDGRSLRSIGAEHGVSDNTVSRALAAGRVPIRSPGRSAAPIDPDWLRRRYYDDHRTLLEIANETGVSMSTISRHLRRAGIPARPRGSASRASALRPDPVADSLLLKRVLVGEGSRQRAERFLIVAEHATLAAAAAHLGIAASVLGIQMSRLEADAGESLLTRARSAHAHELTALGVTLAIELRRCLAPE